VIFDWFIIKQEKLTYRCNHFHVKAHCFISMWRNGYNNETHQLICYWICSVIVNSIFSMDNDNVIFCWLIIKQEKVANLDSDFNHDKVSKSISVYNNETSGNYELYRGRCKLWQNMYFIVMIITEVWVVIFLQWNNVKNITKSFVTFDKL
jgi:hypothetical protein